VAPGLLLFPAPFFFLIVVEEGGGDWTGLSFGGIEDVEASAETSLSVEEVSLVVCRASILLSRQIFACRALKWWCWRPRSSLPESWLESQSSIFVGIVGSMIGTSKGLACCWVGGWVEVRCAYSTGCMSWGATWMLVGRPMEAMALRLFAICGW